MTDKIILLDGSKKLHSKIPLEVIAEIAKLRQVETEYHDCPDFLKTFIDMAYKPKRKQVDAYALTNALHQTQEMKDRYEAGKIIVIDQDAFSGDEDCNFFFGALSKCPESLGYVLVSTARMQSENHARDIIRHEVGHMFGAPSEARNNTYELYGLHCSNTDCVMQQKDSVAKAVRYAEQRAKRNAGTYCGQCEQDIQNFRVK